MYGGNLQSGFMLHGAGGCVTALEGLLALNATMMLVGALFLYLGQQLMVEFLSIFLLNRPVNLFKVNDLICQGPPEDVYT